MTFIKKNISGMLLSFSIALIATYLGKLLPIVGGPVFGIILGMIVSFIPRSEKYQEGIKFTSKKILQYAIILLGFNMNLYQIFSVGKQSLLIIIATITTALLMTYCINKWLNLPTNLAILIGVGSSICGGSAIAATAPVIDADEADVAKAISVIFTFNLVAAFLFPILGQLLNMQDIGFGMWAGTAINDTSSVVAASQTWSVLHGNNIALEYATIVKLTRTLAIIPITLFLAFYRSKKHTGASVNLAKTFPWFILFFLLAAVLNTFLSLGSNLTSLLVSLSKFFITMSLTAIGLNTNPIRLLKEGGKAFILGLGCWISIMLVSLFLQYLLGVL